jgi:hypothetical protein
MATITKRIIQPMGELSCGISLPIGWINYNKLKPGNILELVEEDNIITITIPKDKEGK